MIVILCKNYLEASDAFDMFVNYLEFMEPWSIREIYDSARCVETDDDLRYIFTSYKYDKAFSYLTPDYIDVEDFFETLPNWRYFEEDMHSIFGGFHDID